MSLKVKNNNIDELIAEKQDNQHQMRGDEIECESCSSDYSDYQGNEDFEDCQQLKKLSKNKILSESIQFPKMIQFTKPLGITKSIPQDYNFFNLDEYQEIMTRLEEEKYFRQFRQSLKKDVINQNIEDCKNDHVSTRQNFQMIFNYNIQQVQFEKKGLILNVETSMRIARYQQEEWKIMDNQLMVFVNRNTKKIFVGKTLVEKSKSTIIENEATTQMSKREKEAIARKILNGRRQHKQNQDKFDYQEENFEQQLEDILEEEKNDFEIVDFNQIFKIKMNVFNDLQDFFKDINEFVGKQYNSKYFLLTPHEYWNALQHNLNCHIQFKQLRNIAFPDQTLQGQKGNPIKPRYSFISNDSEQMYFNELVKNEISKIDQLDTFQQQALCHALLNQNALIQGPPGTGKTFLASKIVTVLDRLHNNHTKKPVLVLSKKNISLDQLLLKIQGQNPKIKMLRLGFSTTIEEIKNYDLNAQKGPTRDFKNTTNFQKIDNLLQQFILNQNQRKYQLEYFGEKQFQLSNKLLLEIKKKLINLLEQNLNQSKQQDPISEQTQDKIFTKWLEGKLDAPRLSKYLKQSNINLCDQQKQQLQTQIIIQQQNSPDFQLKKTEQDIRQFFNKLYCFSQFSKQFADFIRNGQESIEIDILQTKMKEYETLSINQNQNTEFQFQNELSEFMKQYSVVGMTLTGYHMHFQAIQQLQPEIVIVEEASEIIESEFFPVLTPSLKHLIQIGDHQQLRPVIKSHILQDKYNYRMSYFERLISVNRIHVKTLYQQRRMRPEFANFTRLFYGKKYIDDDSTKGQNHIKEISKNGMYMLPHTFSDTRMIDNSFINEFEAQYIKFLTQKLINQKKYKEEQIKILTFYKSQKILIQNKLQKFKKVKVFTVDEFQGNESCIIILSCVRSNKENKCGFVLNDQRINVAFSRARNGFFCIGNFQMFATKSQTWQKINQLSFDQFSYGGVSQEALYKNVFETTETKIIFDNHLNKVEKVSKCNNCSRDSHIGDCKENTLYNYFQQPIKKAKQKFIYVQRNMQKQLNLDDEFPTIQDTIHSSKSK